MILIDGKKIRDDILAKVKSEVASLPFQPVFCDVLVGDDPASVQYVQMKARTAERVGIRFHQASFPASILTEELVAEIKILNKIPKMCGIIIQLPLPETIDKRAVLDAIDPLLDVDYLGTVASEKFYSGSIDFGIGFPTALACMTILDSLSLDSNPSTSFDGIEDRSLRTRKIVVLGQGDLVGKPVSALLEFRGLKFDIVRSRTENKEEIIKEADVIISGIGKGKFITGDMIKKGAVIIDAGTSESNDDQPSGQVRVSIVGDVDFESVKDIASYISPVPGGVGPVTVAMLLNNVLQVAKNSPHP